jgi:hypothetical protein
MDNSNAGFRARAEQRRATYSIRRYNNFDQIKADEYAYWQSQPTHVRLAAAAELTAEAYAAKGIHVSRLQRSLVRFKRP